MAEAPAPTAAFGELCDNLDYARNLVRGGRYLERLKVGAFDVADLYRAAWVQAVSALDHWVHRELYDRALGFAVEAAVPRPAKFLQVQVPMKLLEDVQSRSTSMREAFRAELQRQFGYQSFQAPDKIRQALSIVSDAPLWANVAKVLSQRNDTTDSVTSDQVQTRLREIVQRRNRIAHEADRDPAHRGGRNPISDSEATETIDWIANVADVIVTVLGALPTGDITGGAADITPPPRNRWTRHDIDEAVDRINERPVADAIRRLLSHADSRGALVKGGTGADPSAGVYYWLQGNRRSIWSLYVTPGRPSIALNFGSVWPRDQQLAQRMLTEVRRDPSLDAALLHSDDIVVRKYPGVDVAALARSPGALDAIIRALDLVAPGTPQA